MESHKRKQSLGAVLKTGSSERTHRITHDVVVTGVGTQVTQQCIVEGTCMHHSQPKMIITKLLCYVTKIYVILH